MRKTGFALPNPWHRNLSKKYLLVAGVVLCVLGFTMSALENGQSGFFVHGLAMGARVASLVLFAWLTLQRRSLTVWIFWSMIAGLTIGLDAAHFALHLRVFSDLFLRLIEMIMVPLILGVLIAGIGAHGNSRDVSRLAFRSFVYFEALTTIALIVGLLAINISKAGVGLERGEIHSSQVAPSEDQSHTVLQPMQLTWDRFLLNAVPENLAKSIAENHILQVVVFAILFGIALGRLNEERKRPILEFLDSFTGVMFQLTNLIMYTAPFAVGGALAYTVAHSGLGVMIGLSKLVLTLYVAIAAFIVCGMLPAALLARVPLRRFLTAVAEPAAIAFATSTSEAALPIAMERMEELGVPGKIVGFVIPTGYSFNLAGSALYLSLAAVFLAQAGGIHLGWTQQLTMLGTMMLTSKGVAGVPRAVFIVLMTTASSSQLPIEILPLLLGVDALMDMGRATINAAGNCLASVVVAQWEGQFVLSAAKANE
jgi:proton glutamate symport protein